MAHVQIQRTPSGTHRIIVDGIDIAKSVIADGCSVSLASQVLDADRVHMVLAADTLDADLPDAVLQVSRESEDTAHLRRQLADLTRQVGAIQAALDPQRIGHAVASGINKAAQKNRAKR